MTNKKERKLSEIITGGKLICLLCVILWSALLSANGEINSGISDIKEVNNIISDSISKRLYEIYLDSADRAIKAEMWSIAEKYTIKALKERPADKTNWLLWSNLGEIRRQGGNVEGALDAFNIGLSRNPDSRIMLNSRAAVLLELNNKELALEDLNHLLNLYPDSENGRIMRGVLYLEKGEIDNSKKDFNYVKDKYPENADSYAGLAQCYARDKNINEIISNSNESLKREDKESVHILKIITLAEDGKLAEAWEALRIAMKTHPRSGNLFLMRAYLHKLSFRNEEMAIDLKLAKEYGADSDLKESIFGK